MRFADKIEARVKPAMGRRVRALANEREESPAAIIREALEEYFARRETNGVSHVEQPKAAA